jgi:hypothetical protein
MSNSKLNDEITQMYEEMIKTQKLTPVAVQRAVVLYQEMHTIMNKYKDQLRDPESVHSAMLQMDKEIISILAKELDMNFYEGMMDTATKTLISVMKIPQVKELSKQFALDVSGKVPNAGALEDLIKKAFGDKPEQTGDKSAMESILDSISNPGKDRLN